MNVKQIFNGQASKFLVSLLTMVAAALPVWYGSARWEPIVIMGIGAAMTYLVPNAAPPAPPVAPPADAPKSS